MMDPLLRQVLYPAPPVPVPSPPPAPAEELALPLAGGGRAVGWLAEAGAAPRAPLVLFFHGNGENLETMRRAGTFEAFRQLGAAVLAVDYPGYGNSPGTPSEAALAATADAALGWAREHRPERPRIAAGWSLGAAAAVPLARRSGEHLSGLVAMSAWSRLEELAHRLFPVPFLSRLLPDAYDTLAAAPGVRVPALVIHGGADDIIPAAQGRRVAEALAGPVRWVEVPGAGHNDLLARGVVWEELAAFLTEVTEGW